VSVTLRNARSCRRVISGPAATARPVDPDRINRTGSGSCSAGWSYPELADRHCGVTAAVDIGDGFDRMAAGGVEAEVLGTCVAVDCDVSGGDAVIRGSVDGVVFEFVGLGVGVERPGLDFSPGDGFLSLISVPAF
jgi:hypothetical protein